MKPKFLKFSAIIALIVLFTANVAVSQTLQSEMLGLESGPAFRLFEEAADYRIARTDENGKIVWIMDAVNDDSPLNFNESAYIVYGYSTQNGGRIVGDPTAYDYWLVSRDSSIDADLYPNPTRSEVYVFVSDFGESTSIAFYDLGFRQVLDYQLTDNNSVINLANLSQGMYVYKITNDSKIIKGGKLCVL